MKKKILCIVIAAVVVCSIVVGFVQSNASVLGINAVIPQERAGYYENSYLQHLEDHGYSDVMASKVVEVDLKQFSSDDTSVKYDDGVISNEGKTVEFTFNVAETGFYNLEIGYLAVNGNGADIERKITIDDATPYDGLSQITFKRVWENELDVIEIMNNNEVRPNTQEFLAEVFTYISDSEKRTLEPYKIYLTAGTHTVAFYGSRETFKITSLEFKAADEVPTYAEYLTENSGLSVYTGEALVGQAERVDGITVGVLKSSRSIQINSNYSSSMLTPSHPYNTVFNTIGGDSFQMAGDSITWEVEVPQAGLYQLAFTANQSANRGSNSYRSLLVNGEYPFQEAQVIGFPYSSDFQNYVIAGDDGAYLIALEQGVNTITLEVTLGELDRVISEIEESMVILNEAYRNIIQLTGTVPISYIDYEVEKKIPGVRELFTQEYERMLSVYNELLVIGGEKGSDAVTIEKLVLQLETLKNDPEEIVNELETFKNNVSTLGLWSMDASAMPLEIDSLTLSAVDSTYDKTKADPFSAGIYDTIRFLSTFVVDDTNISGTSDNAGESITVWIGSGRDQAQILVNLINETFTPTTGINVNLELIPSSVIMPATLAGIGPDVAVGLTDQQIMAFAVRNSIVDLTQLEGFDSKYTEYAPSAFQPVSYQGGIYGLPEQQSFSMIFYRIDILEELGLEVPKTWDDVKDMIPVLQMNNYEFYLPATSSTDINSTMYSTFVYQAGGDLYLGEGNDYGIQTALYDEINMNAFQGYTEFFTSYSLAVSADFANRFRTGEMPIGISAYTTYNQLQVSASEIRGLWSLAEMPGTVRSDGTIDNTAISTTVQSTILKGTDNLDASWEFLQWWSEDEVQLDYATTLEGIMGPSARYPSAKATVISQLSFTLDEREVITTQLQNTTGIPEVPGGYMSARMIDYAFKNVVTDGQNSREALYLNAKAVDDELTKKREEFHLSTVND